MKARAIGSVIVTTLAVMIGGQAMSQEILLGYLPASAGPFATLSRTNEIAAQMAVEEINAAGGIGGRKIRIVSFDTAGKPDQAVVGLRALAGDSKVLAVIGPFSSSEVRVVFPAAEREGVVSMSMASSAPKLAEPYTYGLRNTSDEGYMISRVVKTMQEKNYAMKAAVVAYATDDLVSKTMGEVVLPNSLKKAGTEIRKSVTFQTQVFDLSAQVSQLKSEPADIVAVGSGPEAAIRLVQELRRQDVKGRVVAGTTVADSELPIRMGKDGNGTIIPTTFYSGVSDKARKFEAELVKRAKAIGIDRTAASQFEASTYDIVLMYAYAMKKANVTGEPSKLVAERTAIRDELRAMKNFPALEGPISFGKNGDALKTIYIVEMKDGHWNLIGTHATQ